MRLVIHRPILCWQLQHKNFVILRKCAPCTVVEFSKTLEKLSSRPSVHYQKLHNVQILDLAPSILCGARNSLFQVRECDKRLCPALVARLLLQTAIHDVLSSI